MRRISPSVVALAAANAGLGVAFGHWWSWVATGFAAGASTANFIWTKLP